MPDIVRVKNLGTTPLRLVYNSQPTVVAPKQEGFIERECAVIYFGNPNLRNDPTAEHFDDKNARNIEFNRLRGMYGASVGYEGADALWEQNKPKAEVAEVSGEKWTTVIEDPQGKDLSVVGMPEPDKEQVLIAMQRQIQELQKQIQSPNEQPQGSPDEDRPTQPRQGRKPVVQAGNDA